VPVDAAGRRVTCEMRTKSRKRSFIDHLVGRESGIFVRGSGRAIPGQDADPNAGNASALEIGIETVN
jgi:hypothetical protein